METKGQETERKGREMEWGMDRGTGTIIADLGGGCQEKSTTGGQL